MGPPETTFVIGVFFGVVALAFFVTPKTSQRNHVALNLSFAVILFLLLLLAGRYF